jgi:hypothetical protein
MYQKCLLGCPTGTKNNFDLCVPECPPGFVETPDGLSCQAEFVKRSAVVREACYANETRIAGRICLGPCATGTVPLEEDSELCFATVPVGLQQYFWTGTNNFSTEIGPLVAKVIFARSQESVTCLPEYENLNGSCFADCPTGSSALGTQCLASCPSGFLLTNNQTACLRPTKKRAVVQSVGQSIAGIATKIVYVIIAIMLIALLASLF